MLWLHHVVLSKLLKVLIIVPELIARFSLKPGNLVKDAKISGAILWTELSHNLVQQITLVVCQVDLSIFVLEVGQNVNGTITLDGRNQSFFVLHTVFLCLQIT